MSYNEIEMNHLNDYMISIIEVMILLHNLDHVGHWIIIHIITLSLEENKLVDIRFN